MLLLECWSPSWLPWQQNEPIRDLKQGHMTLPIHHYLLWSDQFQILEKMLFLECSPPSWLPWQWNEKIQSETSNEVT